MNKLHKIAKIILLSVSTLSSNGICELLFVSSTRSYGIAYDLTEFSGVPESLVAYDQYYSQGLTIYFSNTNDAAWAEVIVPNGTSYSLLKYTKDQNPSNFQNLTNAAVISNSVLMFSEGASFATQSEMEQFLPASQYVTVRFGGGSLGDREDQFLIADSTAFFNSPPQINISASTLSQLINYDSTQELRCLVTSTIPWQLGIQDSRFKSLFNIWPLESNYTLNVPRNLLEPGLVYGVHFYAGTGDLVAATSFAGLTRSASDPPIPMASSGVVS